jgi:acyl-coenzyme A thioesterase PaaI-like protein
VDAAQAVEKVMGGASRLLGGVNLKETALVQLLGITRIPGLFFFGPRVMRVDDEGCEVMIPLGYRTRNHVGSMYFAALAAGADLTGGLNAFVAIRTRHRKVNLIFKDFRAEFLKRGDGDVHFTTTQGRQINEAVAEADRKGERITLPVEILATVPSKYGSEPVARFTLGLSLKRKG